MVAGFAVTSWACGGGGPVCDLDSVLRQRAGAAGVNCGRVAKDASTTATDQCIADQTARAAPFYARYDVQGTDSQVAFGAVSDAAGRSSVLLWDSDPSGGSNVGAQITETVCSGAPPIRTALTSADAPPPVSCTVSVSMTQICS